MSSIGSVTYDVSKHIAGLLSNLVGNSAYHVKDTNSFVDDLKDVTIENDEVMAGADLGFFRGRGGWSRGAAFLE